MSRVTCLKTKNDKCDTLQICQRFDGLHRCLITDAGFMDWYKHEKTDFATVLIDHNDIRFGMMMILVSKLFIGTTKNKKQELIMIYKVYIITKCQQLWLRFSLNCLKIFHQFWSGFA